MSKLMPGQIYRVPPLRAWRPPFGRDWFVGVFRGEDRFKTYVFDLLASPEWGASAVSIDKEYGKHAERISLEDLPLYMHAEVIHPLFERVIKTGRTKRNRRPKKVLAITQPVPAAGLFRRMVQRVMGFFADNRDSMGRFIIREIKDDKVILEPYDQHIKRTKNPVAVSEPYTIALPIKDICCKK